MTRLDQVTGSPDRSTAVLAMVAAAIRDGDPSFANAASKTAPNASFGQLFEDEFQVALAMLQPAEFDPADVAVEPVATVAQGHLSDTAPVTDQDAPIMTRDEAVAELAGRKDALQLARKTRMLAEDDQRRCREAVAAAAMEWARGGPSSDEIRRREIQAINRDRGSKIEHGDPHRPGPSRIDQEAAYRGDASTYLRKQMRFGSHHRAVFIDGEWRQPGRRGAKLPSEV